MLPFGGDTASHHRGLHLLYRQTVFLIGRYQNVGAEHPTSGPVFLCYRVLAPLAAHADVYVLLGRPFPITAPSIVKHRDLPLLYLSYNLPSTQMVQVGVGEKKGVSEKHGERIQK